MHDYWKGQTPVPNFEAAWESWLNEGVVPGTALPAKPVKLVPDLQARLLQNAPGGRSQGSGLEIVFRPDPTIWDGQFANNGWLQELPKPLTKLTWDNAAMLSLATAAASWGEERGCGETPLRRSRGSGPDLDHAGSRG